MESTMTNGNNLFMSRLVSPFRENNLCVSRFVSPFRENKLSMSRLVSPFTGLAKYINPVLKRKRSKTNPAQLTGDAFESPRSSTTGMSRMQENAFPSRSKNSQSDLQQRNRLRSKINPVQSFAGLKDSYTQKRKENQGVMQRNPVQNRIRSKTNPVQHVNRLSDQYKRKGVANFNKDEQVKDNDHELNEDSLDEDSCASPSLNRYHSTISLLTSIYDNRNIIGEDTNNSPASMRRYGSTISFLTSIYNDTHDEDEDDEQIPVVPNNKSISTISLLGAVYSEALHVDEYCEAEDKETL